MCMASSFAGKFSDERRVRIPTGFEELEKVSDRARDASDLDPFECLWIT